MTWKTEDQKNVIIEYISLEKMTVTQPFTIQPHIPIEALFEV